MQLKMKAKRFSSQTNSVPSSPKVNNAQGFSSMLTNKKSKFAMGNKSVSGVVSPSQDAQIQKRKTKEIESLKKLVTPIQDSNYSTSHHLSEQEPSQISQRESIFKKAHKEKPKPKTQAPSELDQGEFAFSFGSDKLNDKKLTFPDITTKIPSLMGTKKVSQFYQGMMKSHFLKEDDYSLFQAQEKKVKQRMRRKTNSQLKFQERERKRSSALKSQQISPSRDLVETIATTQASTYFMMNSHEHEFQAKLGKVQLQSKENQMRRHEFLNSASGIMKKEQLQTPNPFITSTPFGVPNIKSQQTELKSYKFKAQSVQNSPRLLNQSPIDFSVGKTIREIGRDMRQNWVSHSQQRGPNGERSLCEQRCLAKLRRMGWLRPYEQLERVDSLVESICDSEKNRAWGYLETERDVAHNSEVSDENINIYESKDDLSVHKSVSAMESRAEFVQQIQQKFSQKLSVNTSVQGLTPKAGSNQYEKFTGGFKTSKAGNKRSGRQSLLRKFQTTISFKNNTQSEIIEIGGIQVPSLKEINPWELLDALPANLQTTQDKCLKEQSDEDEEDYQARNNVFRQVKGQLKRVRGNKMLIEEVFNHYCHELGVPPVKLLNYFQNGVLQISNYSVSQPLCIAIAMVLPYLVDLEEVVLEANGISDEGAALIFAGAMRCSRVRNFNLTKNEVSTVFQDCFTKFVDKHPRKIQELTLSDCKGVTKILGPMMSYFDHLKSLKVLNLSHNDLDVMTCKNLSTLLRYTKNLNNLNLGYCSMRGQNMRLFLQGLTLNQTLNFLNVSWNSFQSSDHELAAKMARVVQVHPALMHLNMSYTQLKREETMYIAQMLKESKNLISVHLSGNHIDYYSRVFIRAHLNAKVQFPMRNGNKFQQQINVHDRIQLLLLNQLIQANLPADQTQPEVEAFIKDLETVQALKLQQEAGGDTSFRINLQSDQDENEAGESESKKSEKMKTIADFLKSKDCVYKTISNFDAYGQQAKHKQFKESLRRKGYALLKSIKESQSFTNDQKKISAQNSSSAGIFDSQHNRGGGFQRRRKGDLDADFQKALDLIFRAYDDKQLANPMQGFLKEMIFTRYLSHPNITDYEGWKDCNQCFICDRWDKVEINFSGDQEDSIHDLEFEKVISMAQAQRFAAQEAGELRNKKADYEEVSVDEDSQQDSSINFQQVEVKKIFPALKDVSKRSDQTAWEKTLKQSQKDSEGDSKFQSQSQLIREPTKTVLLSHNTQEIQTVLPDEVLSAKEGVLNLVEQVNSNDDESETSALIKQERYDQNIVKIDANKMTRRGGMGSRSNSRKNSRSQISGSKMERVASQFSRKQSLIKQESSNHEDQSEKAANNIESKDELNDQEQSEEHKRAVLEKLRTKILYNPHIFPQQITVEKVKKQVNESDFKPFMKFKQSSGLTQESYISSYPETALVPLYKPFVKNSDLNSSQNRSPEPSSNQKLDKLPAIYSQSPDFLLQATDLPRLNSIQEVESEQKQHTIEESRDQILRVEINRKIHESQNLIETMPQSRIEVQKTLGANNQTVEQKLPKEIFVQNDIFKHWNNLPSQEEVYLFASFNYWFPEKMVKTEKKKVQFHIEKSKTDLNEKEQVFSMQEIEPGEEVAPENIIKTNNYSNFLPAGRHFFYFIRDGKFFCLSKNYSIVRFKDSNLFMNQIEVAERSYENNYCQDDDEVESSEEQEFTLETSIFKFFREDTPELLKKMFELDYGYTKIISRIMKNQSAQEIETVKNILFDNYTKLKNIFLTCVINSDYPILTWNDFTSLCYKCKILDKSMNLATIDRIYIATNVSLHGMDQDRDLHRFEFLEIIVRLAIAKYRDKQNQASTISEALQIFLEDNLFPNIEETFQKNFRINQLYTKEVDQLFVKNEQYLKKIFSMFTHGQKKTMTLRDAIELFNGKCEMRFTERQIIKAYGCSKASVVDILRDPQGHMKLSFTEFLELLGRIAFEMFANSEVFAPQPLHKKLDILLSRLGPSVKIQRQITLVNASTIAEIMNDHTGNLLYLVKKSTAPAEKPNNQDLEDLQQNQQFSGEQEIVAQK